MRWCAQLLGRQDQESGHFHEMPPGSLAAGRVVWGAIQADLPELVEYCTQLLNRLSPRPCSG
jgi:hypothetical protein